MDLCHILFELLNRATSFVSVITQGVPWARARNMLADGVDINLIMKYSGLTPGTNRKIEIRYYLRDDNR
jgi:hypothetical protein